MARKKSVTCERGGLTHVLFPLKRCLWSHLIFQVYMYFISTCHTGWKTLFDKTRSFTSGGVGRGTQQSFMGGSTLRSQPVTLLYTIFDRKGIPFIYLLLTNGTPFTYPAYNYACNAKNPLLNRPSKYKFPPPPRGLVIGIFPSNTK